MPGDPLRYKNRMRFRTKEGEWIREKILDGRGNVRFEDTLIEPAHAADESAQYDPILLAAGIKAPKAKKKRYWEPAERKRCAESFKRLILHGKTVGTIAAEQATEWQLTRYSGVGHVQGRYSGQRGFSRHERRWGKR